MLLNIKSHNFKVPTSTSRPRLKSISSLFLMSFDRSIVCGCQSQQICLSMAVCFSLQMVISLYICLKGGLKTQSFLYVAIQKF